MKYDVLDYDSAHAVVDGNRFLEWDGYDIVTWRKDASGWMDPRGQFKNGVWGIQFRYSLRDDGTWRIPRPYVEHSRS